MENLLNFEVFDKGNNEKTVIIAHGLFGSLKNWRNIAKYLAYLGYQVVVVDMRNHGLSFWNDSHRYEDLADDLRKVIMKFGNFADVVGHSMGGKAAMTLSLLYPECVNRLVVVDIAPVSYEHDQLDYISTMESVNLDLVKTRKELNDQLSQGIESPALRAFFCQNVNFSDVTKKNWVLNLRALRKNMPAIMQFPKLQRCNLSPTLILRGALSEYVIDDYVSEIEHYFPNYILSTIDNSGHWVHSEQSEEFKNHLSRFLTV